MGRLLLVTPGHGGVLRSTLVLAVLLALLLSSSRRVAHLRMSGQHSPCPLAELWPYILRPTPASRGRVSTARPCPGVADRTGWHGMESCRHQTAWKTVEIG